MDNQKLCRINELARKSREASLSEQEIIEQKQLREEYIEGYKISLRSHLDNIILVNPDGTQTKARPKKK